MSADLLHLFDDYDRGRLSRRQLLQALGIAVAIRPAAAFAQGQCGGARAGTPECDTTPAKPPFESTGWKTVLLDHLSCQCVDYAKEAAYYAALMNWKIRSDDGKPAVPRRRPRRAAAAADVVVRAHHATLRSTTFAGASSRGTPRTLKRN